MDNTIRHTRKLTKNQKWVLASTSSGFALENMDVLFLSFAIMASLYLSILLEYI